MKQCFTFLSQDSEKTKYNQDSSQQKRNEMRDETRDKLRDENDRRNERQTRRLNTNITGRQEGINHPDQEERQGQGERQS